MRSLGCDGGGVGIGGNGVELGLRLGVGVAGVGRVGIGGVGRAGVGGAKAGAGAGGIVLGSWDLQDWGWSWAAKRGLGP